MTKGTHLVIRLYDPLITIWIGDVPNCSTIVAVNFSFMDGGNNNYGRPYEVQGEAGRVSYV